MRDNGIEGLTAKSRLGSTRGSSHTKIQVRANAAGLHFELRFGLMVVASMGVSGTGSRCELLGLAAMLVVKQN